jgi:hypothetical protein
MVAKVTVNIEQVPVADLRPDPFGRRLQGSGEPGGMNPSHSQTSHRSLKPQSPDAHQQTTHSPSGRGW